MHSKHLIQVVYMTYHVFALITDRPTYLFNSCISPLAHRSIILPLTAIYICIGETTFCLILTIDARSTIVVNFFLTLSARGPSLCVRI